MNEPDDRPRYLRCRIRQVQAWLNRVRYAVGRALNWRPGPAGRRRDPGAVWVGTGPGGDVRQCQVWKAPDPAEVEDLLRYVRRPTLDDESAAVVRAVLDASEDARRELPVVTLLMEEDEPEPAAPEGATPQERAQALVHRALGNGEAAHREYPVVVLEDELAQCTATTRAEVMDRSYRWLRATIDRRGADGRLTDDSVVRVGAALCVGAAQAIPTEVAHHPHGRSAAVRIMAALDDLGFVPVDTLDLVRARCRQEFYVVPTNGARVARLVREVRALRCRVAAEREAHRRTLAQLHGDDVPDEAFEEV